MDVNLQFLGAAHCVAGSKSLLTLDDPATWHQDTLLVVGYQAEGTRSRDLQQGQQQIKMFGELVPVRCQVKHLDGFSAHADRSELLRWLGQFQTPPKRTFVVYGEPAPAEALAQTLRHEKGWPNVEVPDYLETKMLFAGI